VFKISACEYVLSDLVTVCPGMCVIQENLVYQYTSSDLLVAVSEIFVVSVAVRYYACELFFESFF
jgi:hypothetical protein